MLVSCTAVMGADEYLWIKNDGGVIKFSTDNSTPANTENPYGENTWDGVDYVNNVTLNSTSSSYGLKLEGDLGNVNFTNNSSITATITGYGDSYGIRNERGTIGTLTNNGTITGTSTNSYSYGICNNAGTIGTLTNNGIITGTTSGSGYGIRNERGTIGTLTNNGIITGTSENSSGYGIYNNAGTIGTLTNNGSIIGMKTLGINGNITTLINNGLVIAGTRGIALTNQIGEMKTFTNTGLIAGSNGVNINTKMLNLTNIGVIIGTGKEYENIGMIISVETIANTGSITGITRGNDESSGINLGPGITPGVNIIPTLINNGLIRGITTGSGAGYGVYTRARITTLTNTGAIYGTTNAIKTYRVVIDYLNNYGILATKGNSIKDGTITTENNYGLYITDTTGVVTAGSGGKETIKVGDLERDMTIKNATITAGSDSKATDSFVFSGNPNEFDNSILNGKNDTLKVSGTGNEILGSIINAYETAIVFETAGGELTLSGTNVNGSVEEISNSIIGSDSGDTLILQSGEITYKNTTTGTENTVINGNIDMKAGTDTLTIGSGAVINGNVDMGAGDDILNFVNGAQTNGTIAGGIGSDILNFEKALSARTASSNDDEIRILHSISGFENMNINTNVTLFEKTIKDDDATSTDLEVTGANEIKINAGGVLTLRLDTTRLSDSKIVGHALYGNNGVITSTGGGKLMLALNGAGNKSVVSF
ncbi:beta strand repeat-containing protein, partial [Fusobacterium ulcerans]|uniref:beta strand repeat-containing protein n=1 Tax=Fusobacterium ulcerans TaxID=861 RepID=UPI003872AE59|nr:autotransporter domain-containing protein [Fusobacterium ulcerans]MCB8651007.1 autotransporter domain-containing protein [Fusobacterium ulcerans]